MNLEINYPFSGIGSLQMPCKVTLFFTKILYFCLFKRLIITTMTIGDDFKILSDKTTDGVRHITAVPSAIVCSAQIDFDLIDGKIHNLRYIKGCDGNLQAIGRLLEGMEAGKAVEILSGVNCHGRGTSCSDQLTRVLRKVIG